ncbi:Oxidoreductase, short-chain dehydrogenase/reductase family [hydrothermal vent metagenome]|uniref:Oxidoreductase, short-chain dehydrogenase/reductase family n=1 Tax=hydrothermal vent metagenome TaxID=652676 RepID=A0A3B0VX36_9ZZZZ
MTKNIVIIGATSAIAQATLRLYAESQDNLYLLGRNQEQLNTIAADATVRGAKKVHTAVLDVNQFETHKSTVNQLFETFSTVDIVLIAHGTLPDQAACEKDVHLTMTELSTNGISTISLLTLLANRFEQQKKGCIAVITSVAGDRGRQSNYVYGAAKGMISLFLQGLRNRLYAHNVQVIDIKPGFVDTPMTADFKKGALWAQPEQIAQSITRAIEKKKNATLYTPFFWAGIMLIIRNIPEIIFKRLKL